MITFCLVKSTGMSKEKKNEANKCRQKIFILSRNDNENIELFKEFDKILRTFALKGYISDTNWDYLKDPLIVKIKDVALIINNKYPDFSNTLNNNFDDSLKDIIDIIDQLDNVLYKKAIYNSENLGINLPR